MTLDVVMKHDRTFPFFQSFVENFAKDYQVYLNASLLIKIYQSEIEKLGSIDQMLQSNSNLQVGRARAASKIKEKMEKMPKLKRNKEQLEGDYEQLQVILGQRMMQVSHSHHCLSKLIVLSQFFIEVVIIAYRI